MKPYNMEPFEIGFFLKCFVKYEIDTEDITARVKSEEQNGKPS